MGSIIKLSAPLVIKGAAVVLGGRSALSLSVIVFFIKPTALSEIVIKLTAPNKNKKADIVAEYRL